MGAITAVTLGIAVLNMMGAEDKAESLRRQGEFSKATFDFNAALADIAAEDAEARGRETARRRARKTKQLIGSQRAALAVQGIDIESGSALELLLDTAEVGAEDLFTIKNNAAREAFGFRTRAQDLRNRGIMARFGAEGEASQTLLTGSLRSFQIGAGAVEGIGR